MARGCVIFDFDGVIADTERLHLHAYNQTLAQHAAALGGTLAISTEEYFKKYIVYGNREGFYHMLRDAGLRHDEQMVATLCAAKDGLFVERLGEFADPLPGVREVLSFLEARGVPRAICSGAGRHEIELLLEAFGVQGHFEVVVTIEDVRQGKPDPEGYNKTFALLAAKYDGTLEKGRSLVIEDSAGGCAAARAAGMRVLGVATSLSVAELQRCADFAVGDLGELDHEHLAGWWGV